MTRQIVALKLGQSSVYNRAACDREHRADAEAFFLDRSTKFTGGPRVLAEVLEPVCLCAANRSANEAGVAKFLHQN